VDPRRPRKAKLSAEEMEERLMPYVDTLPVVSLNFISLDKQVCVRACVGTGMCFVCVILLLYIAHALRTDTLPVMSLNFITLTNRCVCECVCVFVNVCVCL